MPAVLNQTGRLDLVIQQGATFNPVWTWKIDGTAVNLTGYTARLTVRDTYGGTALVTLTSGAGTIVLGGAAGTIQPVMSATVTGALSAPATGVYDLELVSGSVVRRLLEGRVSVTPEVTT